MNPHLFRQITSTTNNEVKAVVQLHDTKGRKAQQKFIAEGLRACTDLIDGGMTLVMMYVTEDLIQDAERMVHAKYICLVNNAIMGKMSTLVTPSSMLCVFAIPVQPSWQTMSHGIVLARIADPGNMGTLIRSAAAMNVKTVVVVEGTDVWSPKVVQATAGTLAQVTIFTMSWADLVAHKRDLKLFALIVRGGQKPADLTFKNALLVVGSEANGIPVEWLKDCEIKMTIPMPGNAESLNASVAGSVGLYIAFVQA
jgi:TrmH family RNA methyltransferase